MAEHGADVLRLWVALSDTREDMKLGHQSLTHAKDHYRRFRNCLRFLLGVLHDYDDSIELPPFEELEPLEQDLLNSLFNYDVRHTAWCTQDNCNFRFDEFYNMLHYFCARDLSAFYLERRKDCLYCDGKDSPKRRLSLAVLAITFDRLCKWLAPVLVFTADEAWKLRHGQDKDIHCHDFDTQPLLSLGDYLHEHFSEVQQAKALMSNIKTIIYSVEHKLEHKRDDFTTNSQAELVCYTNMTELLKDIDMKELTMTASFEVKKYSDWENDREYLTAKDFEKILEYGGAEEDVDIKLYLNPEPTKNPKCSRCWRYEHQIEPRLKDKGICARCYEVCYG